MPTLLARNADRKNDSDGLVRRVWNHAHLVCHGMALANAPIPDRHSNPGFDRTRIALVDRLAQSDSDASWIRPFVGDCDQLGCLPLDDGARNDALSGRASVGR